MKTAVGCHAMFVALSLLTACADSIIGGSGSDAGDAGCTDDACVCPNDCSDRDACDLGACSCDASTCQTPPVCIPNAVTCDPEQRFLRTCNSAGTGSTTLDCNLTNRTCFQDMCTGTCIAGRFECNASGQSLECDSNGTWRAPVTCQVGHWCNEDEGPTSGQCVPNNPQVLGKNDTSSVSVTIMDDSLYVVPVVVPWDATLVELGIRTTATSTGGAVYLALYQDSNGEPGVMVNRTANINLVQNSANPGSLALGSPATRFELNANTTYWLAAYTNTAGGTPRIHSDGNTSAGPYRFAHIGSYVSPIDPLVSGWTLQQTGRISIWMSVLRR